MEENSCRLCLRKDPKAKIPIDNFVAINIRNICEIEMDVQIDGFPKNVCKECFETINNIVEFKYKCQTNDQYLRSRLYPINSDNESDHFVYEDTPIKFEIEDENSTIDPIKIVEHFVDICPKKNINKSIKIEANKTKRKIVINKQSHLIRKREDDSKSFKCNICKKKFVQNVTILKHISIHGNVDVKCQECEGYFTSEDGLKKHLDLKHNNLYNQHKKHHKIAKNNDIKSETCNISEAGFVKITYEPEENNAESENKFYCGICKVDNISAAVLKKHLIFHKQRAFTCGYCDKTYKGKWNMVQHMSAMHLSKDTARQCYICGLILKNTEATRKHLVCHMKSNQVKCDICGAILTKGGLKVHLISHSEEKNFECNVCQMKFKTKRCIVSHMVKHSGKKHLPCKYCDMKFNNRKTQKDHEMLHTGERPHHCPVCDMGFIQLSNMKSHFRNNHKDVEFVYKNKRQLRRELMLFM